MLDSSSTGRFCHGDRPTLADICLVPQMVNARNFALDLEQYPRLQRIFNNALAIPAFEKALPKNQQDAE
jgi:glutathione S-transferase